MEKFKKLSILIGGILLITGLIFPAIRLFSLEGFTYLLVLMSESIWLTLDFLGLSLIIIGIVAYKFSSAKMQYTNLKTEVYSIGAGITLGISLYFSLMWLLVVQTSLQQTNPKDYTLSIIITLIGLVSFFLMIGYYFKERRDRKFKKGIGFGILNTAVFILPSFFLADNIYKILIKII